MTQVKRQPQNSASSQFLNNEDSTIVVKILGPRCPSLATSVVQIYMSDATTGKDDSDLLCFKESTSQYILQIALNI